MGERSDQLNHGFRLVGRRLRNPGKVEERRARVGTKLGPRRGNCAECRRRRSDDSVALALATSPSGRVRA